MKDKREFRQIYNLHLLTILVAAHKVLHFSFLMVDNSVSNTRQPCWFNLQLSGSHI